jgi:glyoxylase-like metal-dependent hydrolase (beta-lactamase superfamily II)
MSLKSFNAENLFESLTAKEDFLLLDVRNDAEFARFKVEGPYPFDMINVPYIEFVEMEDKSIPKVPKGKKVRIVCAKEGSAKFVGDLLVKHGHEDVEYMEEGIKAWANLLAPIRVAEGENFKLYQFRRPGKASCSYGLISGKEMVVFEPAKNFQFYLDFAKEKECEISKTFETHRQADYISGSEMLHRVASVEIVAPEGDFSEARFPYTPARDGDTYQLGSSGPEIEVIHTPGHTPGSTCFIINGKYLISGDTVFIKSIGRPDLGGMAEAWSEMLFSTMTDILLKLDGDIVVLPGHYMEWEEAGENLTFAATMEEIRKDNADIYTIADKSAFYDFIRENMRQQPEEYAKIREINAGLVEVDEEQREILDTGKNECAASMYQS